MQDNITQVSEKAIANASAIETLNGEGTGSVKQSIDNAFNEFAANISNDGVVNTYKELIDYAATHGPEFTELVGEVDSISIHVGEVEADISDYKTAVSDQFAEVDETINDNVNEIYESLDGKAALEHEHKIEEVNGLQDLIDELQTNFDNHDENKENPHEVTAEQVGAYTIDEVDAKVASLDILANIDDDGVLFFNTNMLTDASEVLV